MTRKEVSVLLKYKVIFHIDEMNKWKLLLTNVDNLLTAMDNEDFCVEILANSEAVKYYDMSQNIDADINTMDRLNMKGVKFVACNNALIANNIERHNVIQFVDIVPAGVLELVVKQSEGYAYIKP